jgi:predicted  nucleic acid-binding Zn-ribbon protein
MKSNIFFVWSLFISALFIAGNAAFFSVKGIALLFSGSMLPVAIMASSLEIGKLFTVSFLYRYWKETSKLLRFYLITASAVLIAITSLGIYGYLANAFEYTKTQVEMYERNIVQLKEDNKKLNVQISSTETTTDVKDDKTNDALLGYERIYNDFKASAEKERDALRSRQKELEDVIEAINSKGGLFSNAKKNAADELSKQQPERERISKQLQEVDISLKDEYAKFLDKINTLRDDTTSTEETSLVRIDDLYAKIKANDNEITSLNQNITNTDIGTFRFAARALDIETDLAVKWFTLAIVLVFDPLAICLIIGFNVAHVKLYGKQLDLNPNTQTVKQQYKITRAAMKEQKREEGS